MRVVDKVAWVGVVAAISAPFAWVVSLFGAPFFQLWIGWVALQALIIASLGVVKEAAENTVVARRLAEIETEHDSVKASNEEMDEWLISLLEDPEAGV